MKRPASGYRKIIRLVRLVWNGCLYRFDLLMMADKSSFFTFIKKWGIDIAYGVTSLAVIAAIGILPLTASGDLKFPGQGQPALYATADPNDSAALPVTPPRNILSFSTYVVEKGDTISGIA
jgi:hypothetical protein